jgi:hypothetical protein
VAFGSFNSLADLATRYQVRPRYRDFVQLRPREVDERFEKELAFAWDNVPVLASEAAICEFLILPVLREVWRPFSDSLVIWSHMTFGTGELQGVPDYYFSRRPPLGLVPDKPYVLLVEAKKDDFDAGWAQCLVAMLAAQKLNGHPTTVIHGCVSNGRVWEFGKLEGNDFTREVRTFVLSNLPELFAAWNDVLARVKEQALAAAA